MTAKTFRVTLTTDPHGAIRVKPLRPDIQTVYAHYQRRHGFDHPDGTLTLLNAEDLATLGVHRHKLAAVRQAFRQGRQTGQYPVVEVRADVTPTAYGQLVGPGAEELDPFPAPPAEGQPPRRPGPRRFRVLGDDLKALGLSDTAFVCRALNRPIEGKAFYLCVNKLETGSKLNRGRSAGLVFVTVLPEHPEIDSLMPIQAPRLALEAILNPLDDRIGHRRRQTLQDWLSPLLAVYEHHKAKARDWQPGRSEVYRLRLVNGEAVPA